VLTSVILIRLQRYISNLLTHKTLLLMGVVTMNRDTAVSDSMPVLMLHIDFFKVRC